MRRPFGRRVTVFRKRGQPPQGLSSELSKALRSLGESINHTVELLERFEDRSTEPEEVRTDAPRATGPLIPTRRSELLAKIDMRPPFRRQDS